MRRHLMLDEMTCAGDIYAIMGPTASGKTTLGVELAMRIGGEVINCDSVQIYSGIEIATAKPTGSEMRGIPHHLISYVDPKVNYTAADWAADAAAKIREIESRGKVPILVGGTGFYFRTLRQPLFESPKTDGSLRERLRGIHRRRGPRHLHRILRRVDPLAAGRVDEADYVRVIRAIEHFFQTGRPISSEQPKMPPPPDFAARIRLFVLNPPRAVLYERINARAKQHFDRGLIEEVRHLIAAGVPQESNALGAHAYRRVCEYLRGERSLDAAIERSQQDVRNYAKRQLTWFRSEPGAVWLDGFGDEPAVLDRLLSAASRQS
jgi:tRNA dimethylallyltransferase